METLDRAKSGLPEDFPVAAVTVDGPTVEAAVDKLDWHDGDLIMVGSSRLAQPRRLFLGSRPRRCCVSCRYRWRWSQTRKPPTMTEELARTESKASEIGLVFFMGGFGPLLFGVVLMVLMRVWSPD